MTLQHFSSRRLLLQRLARLSQEPRVLHCDHRLRGEILQQSNLFLRERAHLAASRGYHAK